MLAEVKAKTGLPSPLMFMSPRKSNSSQGRDLIQIPAFLCRQTDSTGRGLPRQAGHIKKVSPGPDVAH